MDCFLYSNTMLDGRAFALSAQAFALTVKKTGVRDGKRIVKLHKICLQEYGRKLPGLLLGHLHLAPLSACHQLDRVSHPASVCQEITNCLQLICAAHQRPEKTDTKISRCAFPYLFLCHNSTSWRRCRTSPRFVTNPENHYFVICLHVSAGHKSINFYHILDQRKAVNSSSAPFRPPHVCDRAITGKTVSCFVRDALITQKTGLS